MTSPTREEAWNRIETLGRRAEAGAIRPLFASEPDRFAAFSRRACDILLDYSKTSISTEVMEALIELAEAVMLEGQRAAMAAGQAVNVTERRAVLHMALRAPASAGFTIGEENVSAEVCQTLQAMKAFCEAVHAGTLRSASGETFTDVLNIGIGGSDLGPFAVARALWKPGAPMRPHYLANVDAHAWSTLKRRLDPKRTLVLVASKTFTTAETMQNARLVRDWLAEAMGEEAVPQHLAALSTNLKATAAFGVPADRVFGFKDWVGGRFSLWSAIGLSIALSCGFDAFAQLLAGARAMDEHFLDAPLTENLPVLLALVTIWHVNGLGLPAHAMLPYDDRLARFPAHLQQLEMESLGKRVTMAGLPVQRATGPVIFGEPGTNSQHSFMQMMHQGTTPVPVDFVLVAQPDHPYAENHQLLLANGLAQAEALLRGRDQEEVRAEMTASGASPADIERLLPHRFFPGDRPSTTLLLPKLDAHVLGQLIALYEHKVFCLGALWDIDAFDQWGVELGKQLAGMILPELAPGATPAVHDSSTLGLIAELQRLRGG